MASQKKYFTVLECTATQTYDCFKKLYFLSIIFCVFWGGDFDKATIWIQNSFLTKKMGNIYGESFRRWK